MRNPTRNNGACCFILVEESAGYIQILNSHLKDGTVYRQVRPTVVDSNSQMSDFSP